MVLCSWQSYLKLSTIWRKYLNKSMKKISRSFSFWLSYISIGKHEPIEEMSKCRQFYEYSSKVKSNFIKIIGASLSRLLMKGCLFKILCSDNIVGLQHIVLDILYYSTFVDCSIITYILKVWFLFDSLTVMLHFYIIPHGS